MGTGWNCQAGFAIPAAALGGECQGHPCWVCRNNWHWGWGWNSPSQGPGAQELLLLWVWGCQQGPAQVCRAQWDPQHRSCSVWSPGAVSVTTSSLWDRKDSAKGSRKCCPAGARVSLDEWDKDSGWWCFLVPINLNYLRSDSAALLGGRVRSCLLKSAAFSSQIWIHWFIASNPTRNSEYQLMFVQLYCWSLSLLWPWVNETPLPSCNKKEKCKLRAFQIINPEYNSRHRTHRTRWCSKDKTEHSGARF